MSRLIDADAYAEEMKKRQDACKEWTQRTIDTGDEENYLRSCGAYAVFVEAKLLLENQPTIDVDVKHGEWIEVHDWLQIPQEESGTYRCSACGQVMKYPWNYCPNCGARMQKGHELTEEEIKNIKQKMADLPLVFIQSAQPEPQWIPCSERLPNGQTEVIVSCCDDSGDSKYNYTSFGWMTRDGEYWIVDNEINYYVNAWMPLPEPWKGAKHE